MFHTYLAGAGLLISLVAVVYALSARQYATKCYVYVAETNKRSVTIKKLTEIEVELTEQADSIKALLASLHKLRSRIHARTVNEKKANAADDALPDPNVDPVAWKAHINAQLAQKTTRKE